MPGVGGNQKKAAVATASTAAVADAVDELVDYYKKEFPVLGRIVAGNSGINGINMFAILDLKPEELDALAVDIHKAFQLCSSDESSVSESDRVLQEQLMCSINGVFGVLSMRKDKREYFYDNLTKIVERHLGEEDMNAFQEEMIRDDGSAGGMYNIVRQLIIMNPSNLEALLRMCDTSIQTGSVRCLAFSLLFHLAEEPSIWKIKLSDGSYFSTKLVRTFSKAMEDNAKAKRENINVHGEYCNGCVKCCSHSLYKVLFCVKDRFGLCFEFLDCIYAFDWKAIMKYAFEMGQTDSMELFISLHQSADRALQQDPGNDQAKAFLQKLGSCHELLRSSLQWVISGGAFSTAHSLSLFLSFFSHFVYCLSPLPADRQTTKLVRRAYSILNQRARNDPSVMEIVSVNTLTFMQDAIWESLKRESQEQRWQRFEQLYLSDAYRSNAKQARKVMHRMTKKEPEVHEKMCANCFVLEKDLPEDNKLGICTRCKQIAYCCRDCQVAHWEKAHKKQCRRLGSKQVN